MDLFRNLCVKLRGSLCDVRSYVSAQPLVFLDLAKNSRFMNWKLTVPMAELMDGHELALSKIWETQPQSSLNFPKKSINLPRYVHQKHLRRPNRRQTGGPARGHYHVGHVGSDPFKLLILSGIVLKHPFYLCLYCLF